MTVGIHAGLGRHVYYLDLHQRKLAMQMNIIANPFGALAYSLPNVSVAMFLNRILNLTTGQKWFIYAVAISQNVFALASSILILKQCTPFAFLWDPTIKATCLPLASVLGYSYFIGGWWCILLKCCILRLLNANGYRSLFGIYRRFSRSDSDHRILEDANEAED